MLTPDRTIPLKDGRTAILRNPELTDAQAMIACLKQTASETHFILRAPQECDAITLEFEERFVERMRTSVDSLMYIAEVDGELAGNCQINFNSRVRTHHRATIGIGLRKEYWGLGIGTALMQALIDAAREKGVRQVELEFIEGNSRARALYEKLGFRITGVCPDAIILEDGTLLNEYRMMLKL